LSLESKKREVILPISNCPAWKMCSRSAETCCESDQFDCWILNYNELNLIVSPN